MNTVNTNRKGFTLLELLIVIAIIAVLSVLLIIVLDPAETLKRARDSQRVSDLNTIKTALGIYLTATSTPNLGGGTVTSGVGGTGNICINGSANHGVIAYSVPESTNPSCGSGAGITLGSDAADATGLSTSNYCTTTPSSVYANVDGTGWIPVDFLALSGGSPISNLPVDPINTISATPTSTDLVYRYICQQQGSTVAGKPANAYQLAAVLESSLYGGATGLAAKDGAPNKAYYQVGSDSNLTPATADNW